MKPCDECQTPFDARPRQRFCGDTCRYRWRDRNRASTPCAGGCGALLDRGRGSLPPGERTCRPCRVALAAGRPSKAERRRDRRAAARVARPARRCACGIEIAHLRRQCDTCRQDRRRAWWNRKNARRRGATSLGLAMSVAALGKRDGWRCGICRRKVNPKLPYQHRLAGTRDHLVPVAEGGDDSPANLRLAHRSCNSRRGTRGAVQLALVG